MKSILVPTEQHALLPSILQSALLLARKFDSYMEGFALFPAMVELYALDSGVPLPIEEVRDHDAEMAKQARRAFETFMEGHGVPRAERNSALSFGWLDAAPDGDPFVGSYGRVFDVIVLGRPGPSRWSRPSMTTIEAGPVRIGPSGPDRAALPAPAHRRQYPDRLEWQHRTGEDDGACNAVAQAGYPGRRADGAGRNGAGPERRRARPLSRPQRRCVRTHHRPARQPQHRRGHPGASRRARNPTC